MHHPTSTHYAERFSANIMSLLAISLVIRGLALLGLFPIEEGSIGRHIFSTLEMLMIACLAWQSYQTVCWSKAQTTLVQNTATLCFYSLLFCGVGDLINRNYFSSYYQFDDVLKHSYLIWSALFFLIGYLFILKANLELTRTHISQRFVKYSMTLFAIAGCGMYFINHNSDMSAFSNSVIFFYTITVAVLLASTLWLIKTYGWVSSHVVVIAIVLAPTIADALIGNFWIYRDYSPTIQHVNWLVYFTGLAMTQYLPILASKAKLPAKS